MSTDCYCDYDPPHLYRAAIRTARKPHRCYDCGGPISPGEKYEDVAAIWEYGNGIDVVKTCERCYDIRIWVKNNVPCFCYAHGGLQETAEAAIDDAIYRAPDETAGLRFGFLRRLVLRDKFNQSREAQPSR